jgi:hypothetical protein
MRIRDLVLLVSVVCLGLTIAAGAQTITQQEFLDQLKDHHPLFEKERLTAQIEAEERNSFRGNEDWNVQSSFFYSHEEPSIAFAGPERTDALSIGGAVDRLLWRTGGRFSASFSSSRASMKLDPMFGLPDTYYENRLSLTYIHPLMKNKSGFLDRLKYDLKQYDINLSEVLATEHEEDFLARSAVRFLEWTLLVEQQRIVTERLHLSEEELGNTKEKRSANLIDEVDVIRAEDAVRIASQNLLLIESHAKAIQAEIATLTQDTRYYDATPEYDLYQTVELPPHSEATSQLKENSRLLAAIRITLEQLAIVRSGYSELEKPSLALVAQVGLKNADEGFGSSLALDKPDARVGLQLSFPVEKRTARAKQAQTDLQVMQLGKQLEQLTIDLMSALANLTTQISELAGVLELNQEQIESARRKTVEELKLYNQGRGDLTFVIQSRDSEQAAKLTYAVNALTYHQLVFQYRALMDQLHN